MTGPTRRHRSAATPTALPSSSISSGLTALLLGGIGVGNAIGSYMAKKREIIATFKCLGASSRLVLGVYMIQALFLASLGIALGLVIGALAPSRSPRSTAIRSPSRLRSSRILCRS